MALVPNHWTDQTFPEGPSGVGGIEGRGAVNVISGYHRNPGKKDDDVLLVSTKTVLNEFGTKIRRDEEKWTYEIHGAPPIEYERKVFSNVWLPGVGRSPDREVEIVNIYWWPFSPLAKGDNLGRTKIISGYVIYDKPVTEEPLTGEQIADMYAAGIFPPATNDRIIQSGKFWSDANLSSSIVPQQEAAQFAKWMDAVIVEEELVDEEIDKWTIWNVKKHGLTSAGVEWSGPRHVRKTGFKYKLPVPVQPPKIKAAGLAASVRVEIDGGGAKITNSYFHVSYSIRPQRYHVYRRTISEPNRTADDNLYDWWSTPPVGGGTRMVIENTAVVDENGNSVSALPTAENYTEPEDPSPEDPPPDTDFRRIATVDNGKGENERGHAEYLDTDVEDTAEYEYYATAEIADQESADSNHERQTFSGTGSRSYRMTTLPDGTVDAIAPDDPALGLVEEGDVVEFEVPTTDPDSVTGEIADRAFTQKEPDLQLIVTVKVPVYGLEWGMGAVLPNIVWETFAPGYHISSRTESDRWMLSGFSRRVQRNAQGEWSTPDTVIRLQQRPDPS